jgi:DnaB-like helicase N terminal domain
MESNRLNGNHPARDVTPSAADRMPPANEEAERSVLGCILLDDEVMRGVLNKNGERARGVVDILSVADFFWDDNRIVYQAMLDLYEVGERIDGVSLGDALGKSSIPDVNGLMLELVNTVPHSANYEFYAKIVREKARLRNAAELATEVVNRAYGNQCTADELSEFLNVQAARIESVISEPEEEPSIHPLPTTMGELAFRGVLGEIVRVIAPETEACIEALLLQLLVIFGNAIGPRPHWRAGGTVHRCNLFLCLVGPTAQGRKGTAFDAADWLLRRASNRDRAMMYVRGITTGEGLIGAVNRYHSPFVCVETEFAKVLGNAAREHNNLSAVLRQAWDGKHLHVLTRNNPLECDDAYISLIGHITHSELKGLVGTKDVENGLVNRFLWSHVYRARELPEGGSFEAISSALAPLVHDLMFALDFGLNDSGLDVPFKRDEKARDRWKELYSELTAARPGLYGSATVRAAPIVMRLAVLYSILDRDFYVRTDHLDAALAVWDYCDATARHLWGSPKLEGNLGKLVAFLADAKTGVTRTEISRRCFRGHLTSSELDRLLAQAQVSGLAVYKQVKTKGAPRHEWAIAKDTDDAKKAN